MCILLTGYGKSLIFHLLPMLLFAKYKLRSDVLLGWRSNASSTTVVNSIVIVVSPLNYLMNDQISRLLKHKRNLSVSYRCERFDENMDDDFNVDVDFRLCQVRKLRNGNYHIVFAHPEPLSQANMDESYC